MCRSDSRDTLRVVIGMVQQFVARRERRRHGRLSPRSAEKVEHGSPHAPGPPGRRGRRRGCVPSGNSGEGLALRCAPAPVGRIKTAIFSRHPPLANAAVTAAARRIARYRSWSARSTLTTEFPLGQHPVAVRRRRPRRPNDGGTRDTEAGSRRSCVPAGRPGSRRRQHRHTRSANRTSSCGRRRVGVRTRTAPSGEERRVEDCTCRKVVAGHADEGVRESAPFQPLDGPVESAGKYMP